MGVEAERKERLKAFPPKFQVTTEFFKHAAEDALFMRCLPAHRNEEVKDEAID